MNQLPQGTLTVTEICVCGKHGALASVAAIPDATAEATDRFQLCLYVIGDPMLYWALLFLIVGIVAGLLGFTAIAGATIAIAKLLFFIFIAVFVVLLIAGLSARRRIGL